MELAGHATIAPDPATHLQRRPIQNIDSLVSDIGNIQTALGAIGGSVYV